MWLSLLLGGVIATLSKLAPTREAELVIDCVLGSLALIPFAANRMGTSHVYMFAMGMVSALYLGMPLLAGWGTPDIVTLWKRAVGFVLVSALIGMFAGSVLSMIVLPSLASHEVGCGVRVGVCQDLRSVQDTRDVAPSTAPVTCANRQQGSMTLIS